MATRRPDAQRAPSRAARWLRRGLLAAGGLTLAGTAVVALAPAASADEPPAPGPVSALLGGVGDLAGVVTAPAVEHVVAPLLDAVLPPAAPAPVPPPAPSTPAPVPAVPPGAPPAPDAPESGAAAVPAPAVPAQAVPAPAAPPATDAPAPSAAVPPPATVLPDALAGGLGREVVAPLVDAVRPTVEGVADDVLRPLLGAADALAPVLDPVGADVVAPAVERALAPLVAALRPVLDPAARLTGPVLRPIAAPVVDGVLRPVLGAVRGSAVGRVLDPVVDVLRPGGAVSVPSGSARSTAPTGPVGAAPAVVGAMPAAAGAPGTPSVAGGSSAPDDPVPALVRATRAIERVPDADAAAGVVATVPAAGTERPAAADLPGGPAPAVPAASGGPLRAPASTDVLAVLPVTALLPGRSLVLAAVRDRVALPLRDREVPVSPA
jgi:hypothetical protein